MARVTARQGISSAWRKGGCHMMNHVTGSLESHRPVFSKYPGAGDFNLISSREQLIVDITRTVGSHPQPSLWKIAEILKASVRKPDLLEGLDCPGSQERYSRYALHSAPGLCILALVWRPKQMSPLHSHSSWCALGVHAGELTEICVPPTDAEQSDLSDVPVTCRQLRPGMVSHSAADNGSAHRVANLGVRTAISIHVYGVPYDRLGHDLNRVWAE